MYKVKYVFVILVYRNTDDIIELIKSIQAKVSDYKIIIVNSYYDNASLEAFEKIAQEYSCDFLNVENRGYGYGNNRGFELATQKYNFDFIILSNPDIEIEEFSDSTLDSLNDHLIGPQVTTSTGKSQNPYWATRNKLCEYLVYLGYKKRSRILFYTGVALNKLIRECYLKITQIIGKDTFRVYALHGSFIIFPKKVIKQISSPVYDENIFLFSEEADLAHKLRSKHIKSVATRAIKVHHKEDGSMGIAKIDERSEARKSVIYYYEKWHKRGNK